MELLTFESGNRVIVFEPKDKLNQNGFIEAKDWLNSRTLKTGTFPIYAYNESLCRKSTQQEIDDYMALKDHSLFTLNATK